jgi:ribosomal protein S18 acetylase RimI-like enzyme
VTVPFTIRKTNNEDQAARFETTQVTWRDAYRDIFTEDEMVAVWSGAIPHHHPADELREEFVGGYVAVANSTLVGHILLAILKSGSGEIAAFYVRPSYQGNGIGKALWDEALNDLRGRRCQSADVWVLSKGPAVSFYEKMGCVKFGEEVFSLGEHNESISGYRLPL